METPVPTIEVISVPTEAPTLTVFPTTEPTPTFTVTPTPTIVLSPTPPRPIEWDLNPYYEKYIEQEWEGINIKARVIIDQSFVRKVTIENIEISDVALAEAVARTLFIVWYQRHHPTGYDWQRLAPSEIRPFLEMWLKAQQSGREEDWRRVQIDRVWANDLTDGNGYIQKPYNFWPMYSGVTPSDVVGLEVLTFVYVRTGEVSNIFYQSKGKFMSFGFGSNINEGDHMVYSGFDIEKCDFEDCLAGIFKNAIPSANSFLVQNTGDPPTYWVTSASSIYYKIMHGGIKIDIERK